MARGQGTTGTPPLRHERGFTLIELIIVIMITAILAIGATSFITHSVGGYLDTARRQELAMMGMVAAEKINRELRNALPNSIRVTASGACLEFIPILAGANYLSVPLPGTPDAAATSFDAAPASLTANVTGRVAVYPMTVDPANAHNLYAPASPGPHPLSNVLATAPAPDPADDNKRITVTLAGIHRFPTDSPTRRFFLVGQPIAFCQSGNRLFRYTGYGFIANVSNLQVNLPASGNNRRLILDGLATGAGQTLQWNIAPASLVRNAVVRLSFNLVNPNAPDELLAIEHEVQIRNVP